MAAITTSAANVRPLKGAVVRRFRTGGTVTPGQGVYIASDGDVEANDADALASSHVRGIAVADQNGSTSFPAGTMIDVVVFGPVTGYSGMTPGAIVYNSVTEGALDHTASATSGDYPSVVGYAESATILFVQPQTALPVVVSGG